jgi:hypothetical protein
VGMGVGMSVSMRSLSGMSRGQMGSMRVMNHRGMHSFNAIAALLSVVGRLLLGDDAAFACSYSGAMHHRCGVLTVTVAVAVAVAVMTCEKQVFVVTNPLRMARR